MWTVYALISVIAFGYLICCSFVDPMEMSDVKYKIVSVSLVIALAVGSGCAVLSAHSYATTDSEYNIVSNTTYSSEDDSIHKVCFIGRRNEYKVVYFTEKQYKKYVVGNKVKMNNGEYENLT